MTSDVAHRHGATDEQALRAELRAELQAELSAEATRDRRRFWRSALVLAFSLVSVGVILSSALFTDSDPVAANTFATGNINLTTSPTTALISFSTMAPGDTVTSALTITNSGSLALRYSATSSTTENVLAAQLDLAIKSGVTSCTNGGFASTGSSVYATGDLGNTTPIALFGSSTAGSQAGDRTLAAGASETLCFQVSLPSATTNTYASLTTTATFTFSSEQTVNNP